MRCHLTLVRTAIIKTLQTINAGEDVGKREHSCMVGGNVNWYISFISNLLARTIILMRTCPHAKKASYVHVNLLPCLLSV